MINSPYNPIFKSETEVDVEMRSNCLKKVVEVRRQLEDLLSDYLKKNEKSIRYELKLKKRLWINLNSCNVRICVGTLKSLAYRVGLAISDGSLGSRRSTRSLRFCGSIQLVSAAIVAFGEATIEGVKLYMTKQGDISASISVYVVDRETGTIIRAVKKGDVDVKELCNYFILCEEDVYEYVAGALDGDGSVKFYTTLPCICCSEVRERELHIEVIRRGRINYRLCQDKIEIPPSENPRNKLLRIALAMLYLERRRELLKYALSRRGLSAEDIDEVRLLTLLTPRHVKYLSLIHI